MEEAKANLYLYFSNGNLAAIGEHSDLLAEHDRWLEAYANAKDKLEMLSTVYKYNVKRDDKFEVTEEMLKILNEQQDGN
jgi:hypothetical protein